MDSFIFIAWVIISLALAYFMIVLGSEADDPLNVQIPNHAGDIKGDARFASSGEGDYLVQGNYGEFYSSILAAADGWVQIPSKLSGNEGIDGLCLKAIPSNDGHSQVHVLILETKTEFSWLSEKQMSQQWIIGNLELLFAGSPEGSYRDTLDEIVRAVKRNSRFVHREVWRHKFSTGVTQRYVVDKDRTVTPASRPVPLASSQFMRSVFNATSLFDHKACYIRRDAGSPSGPCS